MNNMYIHVHAAIASTRSPFDNVLHHENNLYSLKYWLQIKFNTHHFSQWNVTHKFVPYVYIEDAATITILAKSEML